MKKSKQVIGYACAYTPLPLLDAAGFMPYRVLPLGDNQDRAGQVLHDNLCPHIKKILDRGLAGDIPDIDYMVFMNSCDSMRRLSDAWRKVTPKERIILVDLPTSDDSKSILFFSKELMRLRDRLSEWCGCAVTDDKLNSSIIKYNSLVTMMDEYKNEVIRKNVPNGSSLMQVLYTRAMTEPLDEVRDYIESHIKELKPGEKNNDSVPVYLFGNVMPDPEVFSLFESCGADIVNENLCTGSRMFYRININGHESLYGGLARELLTRPACARTFSAQGPGRLARDVIAEARASNAQGVIAHSAKFCDPYIGRMPDVRDELKKEGIPFLLLEGDCTLRSMGQQKTRIEAFIEMLR